MKFQIYRLCRNEEKIRELTEQEKKYSLPKTKYLTGIDLYSFINKVIKDCPYEYALLVHDDVILPQNISKNIENSINSADQYFGSNKWGVLGNAGLEIISKKATTFISDPHTNLLPYNTKHPIIVESVDGNTMLINIKNFKEKNIQLPNTLSGYHLYDVILCMEAYRNGLVCGISSWLYVKHLSKGNYQAFKDAIEEEQYQEYFRHFFSNHEIVTINDIIKVKRDYKYLQNVGINLNSFEQIINNVVIDVFKDKKFELNILVRLHTKSQKFIRLLEYIRILNAKLRRHISLNIIIGINNISQKDINDYIEDVKRQYYDLNIQEIYIKDSKKQYPRVNALREMVNSISQQDNSYSWIVDYDDFIMPEIFELMQYLLFEEDVIIGNSNVFKEKWEKEKDTPNISVPDHIITTNNVNKILSGEIFLPICSIIYRTKILKDIFESNDLVGDYFEDYAITLLALKDYNYKCVPISFAGISYHGSNTVVEEDRTHWDYSYTSFLSEIVNRGLIGKVFYDNMSAMLSTEYLEFEGFKKGLIWRLLQKYRKFKKKLINILLKK